MIAEARSQGKNVAADNLEHFLNASGNKRTLDWKWLRQFDSVLRAEEVNRDRFIKTLEKEAENAKIGKVEILDWWDSKQTAGTFKELYYASGTFTVTSYGKFELSCANAGKVEISGAVDHYWWDPYDWHAGLGAYIPGFGNITDQDALDLQNSGKAAPYLMDSIWHEKIYGEYEVKKYWFDSSAFNWTGPFAGSSGAKADVIAKHPSAVRPSSWP